MCKEYNGYPNYQTWNVALWLDNDYNTYNYIQEIAAQEDPDNTWGFADWLKEFVEEINPLDGGDASMFTDILGHAMAQVEYNHIAENILSEFRNDEE